MTVEEINRQILTLSIDDRLEVLKLLLNNMNQIDQSLPLSHIKELDRRLSEIRSGRVKGIPSAQVFSDIEKAYAARR